MSVLHNVCWVLNTKSLLLQRSWSGFWWPHQLQRVWICNKVRTRWSIISILCLKNILCWKDKVKTSDLKIFQNQWNFIYFSQHF